MTIMRKITLKVEGMSCNHCVATIEKNVVAMIGVNEATANLSDKTVTVEFNETKVTEKAIRTTIEEQGYDVL